MMRLACLAPARCLMALAATNTAVRCYSDDHYVNKKAAKKVLDHDDERWLEAEIDENINTPEERYAHEKDLERMRRLLRHLDDKHEDALEDAVKERDAKIAALNAQMKEIHEKLEQIQKQK